MIHLVIMPESGKLEQQTRFHAPTPKRVVSLDALRGFDMLWIIGFGSILRPLFARGDAPFWQNLATQLNHTPWVGLHFWDTIFPLFIFMVGMSMTFSITRRLERGDSRKKLYLHIFKRGWCCFFWD
jgi:predicted acyltransferase